MALTKTVNYVQNKPVSLGFSNEVSGTTGVVTARIKYDGKCGQLLTGIYGSSESYTYGCAQKATFSDTWVIEGTEGDVNAALNGLQWLPRAYDDAAIEQDILALNPTYVDYMGEIQIETSDRHGLFAFNTGDTFQLYTGGVADEYVVTKIDTTTTCGKRMWGVLKEDYCVNDLFNGSSYKNVVLCDTVLRDDQGTAIDYINDFAIVNPHGDCPLTVEILDDGSNHDSGVVTLIGSFFVSEPYFSVNPPSAVTGGTFECDRWSLSLELGEIAQLNDELVTVQILMKHSTNDPLWVGTENKDCASYIEDQTYGVFSTARVGNRQSKSYPDGVVRWEFHGTPAQCNEALKTIKFYQPESNPRDFLIEVRIVNGRTRISHCKGYL